MLNLAMLLDDAARNFPEREAVVSGSTRMTYGELGAAACKVAGALRDRGIGPGDRVALSCVNVAYFPIVYYGILKAGATVVPLNVLLKGPEIAYHLQDSGAKAYFCFEGTSELPMAELGRQGFEESPDCDFMVVLTADPEADSPIEGTETLTELMAGRSPDFSTADRDTNDTAVILYTSGTTGRPKGAELTHSNMLVNAIVSRDLHIKLIDVNEVQVSLVALPLFHSYGQTVLMNGGILDKCTLVLVPRFEPAEVLDVMVREEVTIFAGVPTMYWGLLNQAKKDGTDTSVIAENLVSCTSGGAAMPVELLHAFEETFGVTILEGYGLSETSPVATFNQAGLPRKVGSIGIPVFGTEVRVVDKNDKEVAPGEVGEIVIRGHNVMKGYVNRPEATDEVMRNGWFHTGDLAHMDEDGYLFIRGRLKDMIIRGGFNVYPREIEEVLAEHAAVSMAAVVGVPDEESGEEIKAFIVLEDGVNGISEDEIVDWCEERMAAYKYPRYVEFRDSLPMNATGKILKRELRAEEEEKTAAGKGGD
ncbi:MAG: long-chain-fatty-acid--CoA ligase [Longimicrobiales bacterium]